MISALSGPAYPTGTGVYADEISKQLVKRGHDVDFYSSNFGDFSNFPDCQGVNYYFLKNYGLAFGMNPISNPFFKLCFKKYDVVHIHSYIFLMSNIASFSTFFSENPSLLQFHGGLATNPLFEKNRKMWLKEEIFDPTLGKVTSKLATKVVSIADSDIPLIRKKFSVNASHLPNAVSLEKFQYSNEPGEYITYIGKFEEWKGFRNLLKIFEIVYNKNNTAKFLLVGQGKLDKLIRNSRIPIEVLGHVTHNMMPEIYRKSKMVILPSFMEGSPTACMESQAVGRPIIASNVGDVSKIVQHGITGFVENAIDIEKFASRILMLLEDDTLRHEMGVRGRQHIEKNYCYNSIVNQLVDIYRNIDSE